MHLFPNKPPAASSALERIAMADLCKCGGVHARVSLTEETVAAYADALAGGARFPAPRAFRDPSRPCPTCSRTTYVADGYYTVAAYVRLGSPEVEVEILSGTYTDAILLAVAANARHGLPRTNADKRRGVELVLGIPEFANWTDGRVAEKCAVSDKTVASVRRELGIFTPVRLTANDRTMAIANIGPTPTVQTATNALDEAPEQEVSNVAVLTPPTPEPVRPVTEPEAEDLDDSIQTVGAAPYPPSEVRDGKSAATSPSSPPGADASNVSPAVPKVRGSAADSISDAASSDSQKAALEAFAALGGLSMTASVHPCEAAMFLGYPFEAGEAVAMDDVVQRVADLRRRADEAIASLREYNAVVASDDFKRLRHRIKLGQS